MPKQILVIEDDPVIREMMKEFLDSTYDVLLSKGAQEGLNMLSEDISLVFLDYRLPDASGLETLRQMKKAFPSIPVIFMTGHGSEDICREAFRAGARDYIRKPFERHEICSKAGLFMEMHADQEKRCNKLFDLVRDEQESAADDDIPGDIFGNILKVKAHLDENYTKSLGLSDALKLAGMNKTYFSLYFKQLTGHSLKDYSTHIRVERAKELLRDTDLAVTDIAAMLGYNSVSYFIEMFKKTAGCSPLEFRSGIKSLSAG